MEAGKADVLCRNLIRTLVRLHSVPVPDPGSGRTLSSVGYLRRQVARWIDQWHRNQTQDLPSYGRLADWLGRLETAVRDAQADGAIDPAEDPAQIAFEIEAALLLANAQYIVSRTPEPIERARRAIDRRLAAAGAPAPAPARDAGPRGS